MPAWFLHRLSAGSSQKGGWLGGDKELEEEGRKEDLFGGPVGMRQAERREGNIWRHVCSS